MNDWIEFEGWNFGKFMIRPESIEWISQREDREGAVYTRICVNDGSDVGESMLTSEPYEQVKQKIMNAEKVDLSGVVVEHFTRDEYRTTLELVKDKLLDLGSQPREDVLAELENIRDKLNEILKEEK